MSDKIKDRLAILEELNKVAGGIDDMEDQFSDFDAAMMEMAELGGGMSDMLGMGGMPPIPGMARFGGLGMGAKEVGTYDTVIVHGMRGNYVLTFEETEEGLEITVKK